MQSADSDEGIALLEHWRRRVAHLDVAVDEQRLFEPVERRFWRAALGRQRQLEWHRGADLALHVHLHQRFHHVVGTVGVLEADFQHGDLLIVRHRSKRRELIFDRL